MSLTCTKLPDEPLVPLQKEALLGLARGALTLGRNVARGMGSKFGPSQIATKLKPFTDKVEEGAVKGVGNVLGAPGASVARTTLKGSVGEAARQAAGGAAIGGVFEGGINAALANEGERGGAFMKGLGSGAASGAAFGGLAGGLGQMTKNIRHSAAQQAAVRGGVGGKANVNQAARDFMGRGVQQNLKDFTMNTGPGRAVAGAGLAGSTAQLGSEFIAPSLMMPGAESTPKSPTAMPAPGGSQKMGMELGEKEIPTGAITAPLGMGAGAIGAGGAVDYLKELNRFPKGGRGNLLGRAIPTVAAVSGSLLGLQAGRHYDAMQPPAVPDEESLESKLNQIDFDKLMRYYKKREADQINA